MNSQADLKRYNAHSVVTPHDQSSSLRHRLESGSGIALNVISIMHHPALQKNLFLESVKRRHSLISLSIMIGHMIDGLASYISIYDPLKMGLPIYIEKHPASNVLMEIWPPLFPLVKFLLIIFIIYIFDILYKEELKNYQTFVNLLKIGILILGFSPGVRDLLRVTMGV